MQGLGVLEFKGFRVQGSGVLKCRVFRVQGLVF